MTLTQVSFDVPGTPVAKGRPRATIRGGRAAMFTPAKTEHYESKVALFAKQAMAGRTPLDGALAVSLIAVMPVPASWSKKKRAAALAGDVRPTGRPDGDNLAKAIGDGGNGIVWTDDCRIVDWRIIKRYGDVPGVRVRVHVLTEAA